MTDMTLLADFYTSHEGDCVPGDLNPNDHVDVVFRDGTERTGFLAAELRWTMADSGASGSDIVMWRHTPRPGEEGPTNVVIHEPGFFKVDFAKPEPTRKHNHYFKDVSHLDTVDVYRVLALFNVTDQALGHAIKKLLVAGGRGAGKDIQRDVREAVDTLERFLEMRGEDCDGE